MCRGGRPGSDSSHRVSSKPESANRIRIGYNVPDLSPVFRLMSYPYFQSLAECRNWASTQSVWSDLRILTVQVYIYRFNYVK